MPVGKENPGSGQSDKMLIMQKNAKSFVSIALILTGLLMVMFGNFWAPITFQVLASSETGAWMEHFIAFFPLAIIGVGGALYSSK
ncbi:MAG: hypothetical protein ACI9H8_002071 [Lysobacterales bacterium]|jgi:hypothetical protein